MIRRFLCGLCLLIIACTDETIEEVSDAGSNGDAISNSDAESIGEDAMSLAKSVTGQLVSGGNSVVMVQDDFDGSAQNFTVQFLVNERAGFNPGTGVQNITPVAEILWALGGNTQRRLVSVFDGAAVTGVAEHFTIKVTDQTDPGDVLTPTKYNVTVTVARGVRGSTALPPIYQNYIINGADIKLGLLFLPPTSNAIVPIPKNAGINSVMVTAYVSGTVLTGAEFNFQQRNVTGVIKTYNPMIYTFVPLSPQADNLLFQNLTPVLGGVGITFTITWGIDG